MAKYESFIQYLTIHYSSIISKGLEKFVLNHKKSECKKSKVKCPYNFSEVVHLELMNVKFTKSELEYVEFDIFLSADYYLCNKKNPVCTMETFSNRLFCCHMKGSFNEGFVIGKGKIDTINQKPFEEKLTKALVHVVDSEKMELYAAKFLKYYCPEALKTPMALDLTKILNDKGVTWHAAPLTSGVYGKIYFADDYAEIYDDYQHKEKVCVKRGTILINTIKASERGDGALRNTIVHEAVHWFYHNNYFGLRHLLNTEKTCAICYKGEMEYEDEDVRWMEIQAKSLAPKILMPKKMFIKKFKEEFNRFKKIYNALKKFNNKEFNNADILTDTITSLATFFEVSKQSVKYRLIQLGYYEADGVINYNPETKKYYTNYEFDKTNMNRHQTFHVSKETYFSLIQKNDVILEDIKSRKIIYVNGLLVINNPKYIINDKITEYALKHADECCMKINVKSSTTPLKSSKNVFHLCAGTSSKVDAVIDEEQYVKIIALASENAMHFEKHKKVIPSTFGETIEYHCRKTGQSYEWIADVCDITATTLRKFRNEEFEDIKIINIIKFGLGLKLSQPYIQDLINKAGITLTRISKQNTILLVMLSTFQRIGLKKAFKILKANNNEKYLNLSKRYINKYGL